jgi:hypothetical protein
MLRTLSKPVTKKEFVELLEFAYQKGTLIFGQDLDGSFWPIPGKGLSNKEGRNPITDGPSLLHKIAQIHSEECPQGGKFRVTFAGGWSLLKKQWFVLWTKSSDLVLYDQLTPTMSTEGIDLFRMMAKQDPPKN